MPTAARPTLGICQWFHYQDHRAVERALHHIRDLGIRHLRTGISWADYVRPRGRAWYDWQMRALADAGRNGGLDILLSIWHVPPSISRGGSCASPPRVLKDFADFLDVIITDYGDCFADLELWNEPNNRLKWDFANFDPEWSLFGEMIGTAASWAKQRGRRTVLGGMIPVDHHWLNLMKSYGVLPYIDVVAIHAFPGMWWPEAPCWDWHSHWQGWQHKIEYMAGHADGRPIWVTETGLATCPPPAAGSGEPARHDMQSQALLSAAAAPAERIYWYSLIDLDPARPAIEGFHVEENEYHMGLVTHDGHEKPAYETMRRLLAGTQVIVAQREP